MARQGYNRSTAIADWRTAYNRNVSNHLFWLATRKEFGQSVSRRESEQDKKQTVYH